MSLQPRLPVTQAAIVGAGPAGLISFASLRYGGLPAEQITVFDDCEPLQAWGETTRAIHQRSMRSESDGHFFPTDYPGFALVDALRARSPGPLVRSAVNRYHPSCEDIQRHGLALAAHFGLGASLRSHRVARITLEDEPEPHVVLRDAAGDELARVRHTLLALGHGPLRWPAALSEAHRETLHGRVMHAYEPKTYGPQRYLVIGSGMAAATEWINILRAGGSVVSLRRSDEPVHQALSAPRCYFAGSWLDNYHTLSAGDRLAILRGLARGTYPIRSSWEAEVAAATPAGRYQPVVGEAVSVQEDDGSLAIRIAGASGERVAHVDQVIAATGFAPGWRAHDVLRDLVEAGALEVASTFPILADDCSISALTGRHRTVAIAGSLAAWAFPAADSFAGMKYAARRFSTRALGRSISGPTRVLTWARMVGAPSGRAKPASEICVSP